MAYSPGFVSRGGASSRRRLAEAAEVEHRHVHAHLARDGAPAAAHAGGAGAVRVGAREPSAKPIASVAMTVSRRDPRAVVADRHALHTWCGVAHLRLEREHGLEHRCAGRRARRRRGIARALEQLVLRLVVVFAAPALLGGFRAAAAPPAAAAGRGVKLLRGEGIIIGAVSWRIFSVATCSESSASSSRRAPSACVPPAARLRREQQRELRRVYLAVVELAASAMCVHGRRSARRRPRRRRELGDDVGRGAGLDAVVPATDGERSVRLNIAAEVFCGRARGGRARTASRAPNESWLRSAPARAAARARGLLARACRAGDARPPPPPPPARRRRRPAGSGGGRLDRRGSGGRRARPRSACACARRPARGGRASRCSSRTSRARRGYAVLSITWRRSRPRRRPRASRAAARARSRSSRSSSRCGAPRTAATRTRPTREHDDAHGRREPDARSSTPAEKSLSFIPDGPALCRSALGQRLNAAKKSIPQNAWSVRATYGAPWPWRPTTAITPRWPCAVAAACTAAFERRAGVDLGAAARVEAAGVDRAAAARPEHREVRSKKLTWWPARSRLGSGAAGRGLRRGGERRAHDAAEPTSARPRRPPVGGISHVAQPVDRARGAPAASSASPRSGVGSSAGSRASAAARRTAVRAQLLTDGGDVVGARRRGRRRERPPGASTTGSAPLAASRAADLVAAVDDADRERGRGRGRTGSRRARSFVERLAADVAVAPVAPRPRARPRRAASAPCRRAAATGARAPRRRRRTARPRRRAGRGTRRPRTPRSRKRGGRAHVARTGPSRTRRRAGARAPRRPRPPGGRHSLRGHRLLDAEAADDEAPCARSGAMPRPRPRSPCAGSEPCASVTMPRSSKERMAAEIASATLASSSRRARRRRRRRRGVELEPSSAAAASPPAPPAPPNVNVSPSSPTSVKLGNDGSGASAAGAMVSTCRCRSRRTCSTLGSPWTMRRRE